MTENEKLRALLAEALDAMHCEDDGDGITSHRCGRCDEFVDRNDKVRDRINAALAEPVVECARCETLRDLADKAAWAQGDAQRRMIRAQTQRDEARSELNFIQKEYAKANASDLTRDALAMQNAALKLGLDRVMAERDEAESELTLHKQDRLRLRAEDLRLHREVERLTKVLEDKP